MEIKEIHLIQEKRQTTDGIITIYTGIIIIYSVKLIKYPTESRQVGQHAKTHRLLYYNTTQLIINHSPHSLKGGIYALLPLTSVVRLRLIHIIYTLKINYHSPALIKRGVSLSVRLCLCQYILITPKELNITAQPSLRGGIPTGGQVSPRHLLKNTPKELSHKPITLKGGGASVSVRVCGCRYIINRLILEYKITKSHNKYGDANSLIMRRNLGGVFWLGLTFPFSIYATPRFHFKREDWIDGLV
jgi:hypothetical protein